MFGIPKNMKLNKALYSLLTVVLIMHIASNIVIPILPVILRSEAGLDPTKIGVVIGSFSIAFQLGSIIGGLLSDRVGKRPTMFVGALIQMSALIGFGVSDSYLMFVLFSLLNGVGAGIYAPTVKAAIATLANESKDMETTAFSLRGIFANIGVGIAGLIILILSASKSNIIFFSAAGIYLLLAIFTWIFISKDCERKRCPKIPLNSYLLIFKNKPFVVFAILLIFINAIYAQLGLLLPLRGEAIFENGKIVGSIWTITSVAVIIFQGYINRRILQKFNPMTSLFWSLLIFAGGILLIGLSGNYYLLALSAVIFFFGEMLMLPTTDSLISQFAHADLIGAYFSIANLIYGIGTALGAFVGGRIIDRFGVDTTLLPWGIIAGFSIAVAILLAIVRQFPSIKNTIH
ncbi:MFS transporter [Haloplasma contractile]|uniref:Multidrug resistance protein B n=1 Tax=Haloplasma contractile SSD-17B TaxID=1033810 RepID=U2EBB1_9MOLU|nr:MFS transporter [Haloplasma contractile]ERJ12076.1 Multidrug resistance protein B [Haloplasma contractile SSD-17B]